MRLILLFLTLFAFAAPAAAQAAHTETIAAVVNSDAISMSDLADRIKLMTVSSGLPDTPDIRSKIAPQAISSLIEEQIMLQEADHQKIDVSKEEVDQGFATIAQQNNMDLDQFRKLVAASGMNPATMEHQIRSQIAWSKVVQKELRPKVIISDADIDGFISRVRANIGKNEYLAAEIFLPVENPGEDSDAHQLASRLVSEIRSGKAPFFKLAQQFSKAAGAAQGGDLGWVQQGQLAEELDAALGNLQKNQVSDPVRTLNGYHILLLRDQRAISEQTVPTRDQAMTALGIERLERMQRRYLLDLKTSAFVENRVGS